MSPATDPVLDLAGVTHRFGGTLALSDVDFAVRAGEVHGLIGHNGAGKSTLIKAMAGVLAPQAGRIAVAGQPLDLGQPAAAYRAGLRFIHQNAPLVPIFDAVENCFLGRPYPHRHGMIDRRAMRSAVTAMAQTLAPDMPLNVPASRLSAGMRQLVQIVRALCDQGRVLVLDEPTASLSAEETDRLLRAIGALRTRGIGIVFVSHRLDEVIRIADRVTCLRDGHVSATCLASEVSVTDLVRLIGGKAGASPESGRFSEANQPGLEISGLKCSRHASLLDLSVAAGEVVVLYGRNGAGRSRLLSSLWGSRPRYGGTVSVGGTPYVSHSPRQAIDAGVAYVPDDRRRRGVLPTMSLVANMTMPRLGRYRLARMLPVPSRRRERAAFHSAAKELRLVFGSPTQAAGTLSGGNQQKLLFARWHRTAPRLMLLDEPTEGVDVGAKTEIYRLIRNAAGQGAAVLVASSDRDEALELADRVVVMRSGRIVGDFLRGEANADVLETAAQADL